MVINDEQFSKLKEIERFIIKESSPGLFDVLLGLDLVRTDCLYDTSETKTIECEENTLALADVNNCCVKVDSTILKDLSDYYGILGGLIEDAEKESNQPPEFAYMQSGFKFDMFDKDNENYKQFVNLFK